MPENIIAMRVASYHKFAPDALAHLASIGLTNVEIPVPNPQLIGAVKAGLEKYGMKATSLAGTWEFSAAGAHGHANEYNVAKTMDWQCEACQFLGAKFLFLSAKRGDLPAAEAYAQLRAAGDVAAKYGVTIVLETHPDMITNGEIALETMKGVNHPNVLVNWDTANCYYYCNEDGKFDGVDSMLKVVDYIGAVHLKETDGGFHSWYFPGLGEGKGIVDFPRVFKELNSRGFYGPFTMEIEHCANEDLTEELVKGRMAGSMAYLRKIGVIK